jgi:hypothetical protein
MAIKKEGLAAENPALWLEGMLQWLWEAGQPQRRTISLVQLTSGTGDSPACDFDAVPLKACDDPTLAGAIDKWLAALLAEMLIDRGCDHLPFACIQKYRDKLSMSVIAEDLAAEHPGYRSYLPAFALVDARLPGYSDETLGAVVRNRFAPMLDAWLIAGGAPH